MLVPCFLASVERARVGVALRLEIENGVDGARGAAVADSDHDRVLVGTHDVGDAVEHIVSPVLRLVNEPPLYHGGRVLSSVGFEVFHDGADLGLDASVDLAQALLTSGEDILCIIDLGVDLVDPPLMFGDASLSRLGTVAKDLLGLTDLLLDLGLVLQHDGNVGVAAGVFLGLLDAEAL